MRARVLPVSKNDHLEQSVSHSAPLARKTLVQRWTIDILLLRSRDNGIPNPLEIYSFNLFSIVCVGEASVCHSTRNNHAIAPHTCMSIQWCCLSFIVERTRFAANP